jgi:glycolate oxidase iron-sulfur subunit
MNFLATMGSFFKPLLPRELKLYLPEKQTTNYAINSASATRKVVLLDGCAQQALTPGTNAAIRFVLDKLSIQVLELPGEKCCGALQYHLDFQEDAFDKARRNIDSMLEMLDAGADTIISSASGCGTFLKEYDKLLASDENYSAKAKRVVAHIKDISEMFSAAELELLKTNIPAESKMAFHCPCTLMHGQGLNGHVTGVLTKLGFKLTDVNEAHICCGSAGTYSITQKAMSHKLRKRKIDNLEHGDPAAIATANIGCQLHLGQATDKKVKHWIEYVAEALQ